MARKKTVIAEPAKNGDHGEPRTFTARVTDTERLEFGKRKALFEHYYQLLQAVELRYRLYQQQIQKAYDLPPEFLINLETGEITWKATAMEQLYARGTNG